MSEIITVNQIESKKFIIGILEEMPVFDGFKSIKNHKIQYKEIRRFPIDYKELKLFRQFENIQISVVDKEINLKPVGLDGDIKKSDYDYDKIKENDIDDLFTVESATVINFKYMFKIIGKYMNNKSHIILCLNSLPDYPIMLKLENNGIECTFIIANKVY